MISLLGAAKAAPPDKVDLVRQVIARRCTQDNWTAAAMNCFNTIEKLDDGDRCERMLTEEQADALEKDGKATVGQLAEPDEHAAPTPKLEQAAPAAAAAPAPVAPTVAEPAASPKAKKATRGPKPKSSRTGDPCEGGE